MEILCVGFVDYELDDEDVEFFVGIMFGEDGI